MCHASLCKVISDTTLSWHMMLVSFQFHTVPMSFLHQGGIESCAWALKLSCWSHQILTGFLIHVPTLFQLIDFLKLTVKSLKLLHVAFIFWFSVFTMLLPMDASRTQNPTIALLNTLINTYHFHGHIWLLTKTFHWTWQDSFHTTIKYWCCIEVLICNMITCGSKFPFQLAVLRVFKGL